MPGRSFLHHFRRLKLIPIGLLILLIGIQGCQPAASPAVIKGEQAERSEPQSGEPASGEIEVLATVGMVADIARNVGGSRVRVVQLMGPGVDPHLYNPSRDDVQKIRSAEVVLYSGLMLEGHLQSSLDQVGKSKEVRAIASVQQPADTLKADDGSNHHDPHVWMDVSLWSRGTEVAVEVFSARRPQHSKEFQANAAAYRAELEKLHAYGQKVLASIPENQRVLITSHDAFRYLGRAYGLKVESVQGVSTESETGLVRINELVSKIVDNRIATVFIESSVPIKGVEALIEGAKARSHSVRVGGTLFSDAMGPADSYVGTYVGMMDHNFTAIARSLGGTAPARGFQGKLEPTD